jgi:methyl-accepting chemotaxis protein
MSDTQSTVTSPEETIMTDGAAPSQSELRQLLNILLRVREGDFSVRFPSDWNGLTGKIADCLNDLVSANQGMAEQLERVGQAVGKEGQTLRRVRFPRHTGAWAEMET